MPVKSTSSRYGSVAILIHWTSALAILLLLASGLWSASQADPAAKEALLRLHVPLGVGIFILTLLRILWWAVADRHPAPPADQPRWQRLTANVVHALIYVVILLMATSGIATVVSSGALPAIFAGAPLPDFEDLIPRIAHRVIARIVLLLLAIHIAAALYHQFVRRDRLLARMGVGPA